MLLTVSPIILLKAAAALAAAIGCFGAVALAAEPAAGPAALLEAATHEPRAYGYQVGDVAVRGISVNVPVGLVLDEASVPQPGARGKAIELRSVARRHARAPGGQRIEFTLEYQLFAAPPQVRTFELPTLTLRFKGLPRDQDLRIEAWPVSVAPLVAVEVSPRRGLGELQPDAPAPRLDTAPARQRLLAAAVAATLLAALLAQVYFGVPWRARAMRPFAQAWRTLRRLDATTSPEAAWRDVTRSLHRALDRTAGEVVFAHGIDRLIAAQPRFAPLRDDLARFFELSRREFFAAGDGAVIDRPWLIDFARRCRNAERGTA